MGTTVYEMQPIFYPGGTFSWSIVLLNFTTGTFIGLIGLIVLIYQLSKKGDGERTMLIVWSIVMLLATLAMRRFAYYYVVNVALLTAYVSWLVLSFAGFGKDKVQVAEVKGKSRKKHGRGRKRQSASAVNMGLAAMVIFFLVFYPNMGPLPKVGTIPAGTKLAFQVAGQPQFAPSNGWMEALDWMNGNTPEPFDSASYYYSRYESPKAGEKYEYPDTAYGVACWWDYGYWVTRIGKRIPVSSPGSGHNGETFLFLAQNEDDTKKFMDVRGAKYIVVDYQIAIPKYKFYAVAAYSGQGMGKTFDVYYEVEQEKLVPALLYYPEYYRSFIARLYNFDGKEVKPDNTIVISYDETLAPDGNTYKVINDSKSFKDYGAALEPLKDYKLIYSSKESAEMSRIGIENEIKIFEYTGFGTVDQ